MISEHESIQIRPKFDKMKASRAPDVEPVVYFVSLIGLGIPHNQSGRYAFPITLRRFVSIHNEVSDVLFTKLRSFPVDSLNGNREMSGILTTGSALYEYHPKMNMSVRDSVAATNEISISITFLV